MDGKSDLAAVVCVKIGMRRKERLGFCNRCGAKTIDVVMAVAFGMGHADQRAEGEILLHTEPGLAGQVLAGDEVGLA